MILHKNFDSNHIFVISCIGANEFGQFGLVELERTLRNICRLFTHFIIDLLAREPQTINRLCAIENHFDTGSKCFRREPIKAYHGNDVSELVFFGGTINFYR